MLVYPAGFPSGVEDGGNINIIRGAHLYCDTTAESADVSPASQSGMSVSGSVANDRAMEEGWMKGKTHPVTGQPLRCERLDLPRARSSAATHVRHTQPRPLSRSPL